MNNYNLFQELLDLRTRPVTVTFVDEKPEDMPHVGGEPASCGYWRRAAEGEVFYTEAHDQYDCPIGAHTHGVQVPDARKKELDEMLKMMCDACYISMDEVPAIPHRTDPFKMAVYGPLGKTPGTPDVVLFRGPARQMMILAEASTAAGIAGDTPTLGRPTCAILPAAMQSGKTAASFGCIGNRVYTASRDEDAYFAVPGTALDALAEKIQVIVTANKKLEVFHRERVA